MKQLTITPQMIQKQIENLQALIGKPNINKSFDIKIPFTSVKAEGKKRIKILMKRVAHKKMVQLVAQCDAEVAWNATVTKTSKKMYVINDVYVFPQIVTGVTVESTDEYGIWRNSQPDSVFNSMRCHGHSHVNMGVTPSSTDLTFQQDELQGIEDFYIFLIMNKKGDVNIWLYDIPGNCMYDKDDIDIWYEEDDDIRIQIEKEIKANVKKHVRTNTQYSMGNSYYNAGNTRYNKTTEKNTLIKKEKDKVTLDKNVDDTWTEMVNDLIESYKDMAYTDKMMLSNEIFIPGEYGAWYLGIFHSYTLNPEYDPFNPDFKFEGVI